MQRSNAMTDRLLRLPDIIGRKDKETGKEIIKGLLPISATSWWNGCKSGKYPKPIKLGLRTTTWRESEVLAIVQKGAAHE